MTPNLILLADSQLLFAGAYSGGFREFLRQRVNGKRGVYLGASNGDVPEFFELGQTAFAALGATLIFQSMHAETLADDADFYLLAGGDVAQGWRYMSRPAVLAALQRARAKRALFIGISAGAMHLASGFVSPDLPLQSFLGWMEVAVAVHEERDAWPTRRQWQRYAPVSLPLLCIPMGGAFLWQENHGYQAGKGALWFDVTGAERCLPMLSPAVPVSG